MAPPRSTYKEYKSRSSCKRMPARTKYRLRQQRREFNSGRGIVKSNSEQHPTKNPEDQNHAMDSTFTEVQFQDSLQNAEINEPHTFPEGSAREDNNTCSDLLGNNIRCLSSDEDREEKDYVGQDIPKDTLNEPLYNGASLLLRHAVFLLLAFINMCGCSKQQIQLLLDILHVMLPPSCTLPRTLYQFEQIVKSGDYERILMCPTCKSVIGRTRADVDTVNEDVNFTCRLCPAVHSQKQLLEDRSFFLHTNLEKQLKFLLEDLNLGEQLEHRFTRAKMNDLSDIYDGHMYKSFNDGELLKNRTALSLTANTDGVPLFESSKNSMWPVYFTVNEFPPEVRKKHVILSSLWCGNGQPDFHSFLSPFCEEVNMLSTHGFCWSYDKTRIRNSKLYLLMVGCDTPARCKLQNTKQFNGKLGCCWCLANTVRANESSSKLVYPHDQSHQTLRTDPETRSQGNEALHSGSIIQGVKGPCVFADIGHFDTVKGFVVDSMHCVDLGVVRQMVNKLWLNTNRHAEPYYIGSSANIAKLDAALRNFKVPNEFTRTPRSLNDRAYWKASEYRNFLLYYYVVLENVLPNRYFQHFSLLSEVIHTLSKPCSQVDVYYCTEKLNKFVADFQKLYSLQEMTYNVHQLLHIPDCVCSWGPLNGYDNYVFEGANGVLLQLFNGSRNISEQIYKRIGHTQLLRIQAAELKKSRPHVYKIIQSVVTKQRLTAKSAEIDDCRLLGTPSSRELNAYRKELVSAAVGPTVSSSGKFYHRMVYKLSVFNNCTYTRSQKRIDHVLHTTKGFFSIVDILSVIQSSGKETVLLLAKEIRVSNHLTLGRSHVKVASEDSCNNPERIILPCEILSKCCVVMNRTTELIAPLANVLF